MRTYPYRSNRKFPAGTLKKKYRWRRKWIKGKKGFAKAVKKVILSTAESKYRSVRMTDCYTTSSVGTVIPMTQWVGVTGAFYVNHNRLFRFNIFSNNNPDVNKHPVPSQGNGDGQRNGDEIYAKGIKLRMCLTNGTDHHNAKWRFWLVEWNTVQGDPCVYDNMFHNVSGNLMLDAIQTDRFRATKIGDYRYRSTDISPSVNGEILVSKWIPFKRKLCFTADDSIVIAKGMKEALTIVGVCYDSQNTSQEISIGGITCHATLYYGDP